MEETVLLAVGELKLGSQTIVATADNPLEKYDVGAAV
jgi:hypothetical protein